MRNFAMFGCGGIGIVLLILAMIGWFWLRGFIARFEENPQLAAVELMVRANPELEMVGNDGDAGTVTIRIRESGEVVTVELDEIADGRLSITTSEGEMVFELDEEGDQLVMRGRQGEEESTVTIGRQDGQVPGWVEPLLPAAWPEGRVGMQASSGGRTRGMISWQLEDTDPADVIGGLRQSLEDTGWEVEESSFTTGGQQMSALSAKLDEPARELQIQAIRQQGETTQINVTFDGPDQD